MRAAPVELDENWRAPGRDRPGSEGRSAKGQRPGAGEIHRLERYSLCRFTRVAIRADGDAGSLLEHPQVRPCNTTDGNGNSTRLPRKSGLCACRSRMGGRRASGECAKPAAPRLPIYVSSGRSMWCDGIHRNPDRQNREGRFRQGRNRCQADQTGRRPPRPLRNLAVSPMRFH